MSQVNIWVPQPEKQLDVIKVTGLVANVERAKQGLMERVKDLQAEQEDRVRVQQSNHNYYIVKIFERLRFLRCSMSFLRPCAVSR